MQKTLVRDVMSTDVPEVGPATPFQGLVALLRGNHLRALLVSGAGRRPLGVITAGDLIVIQADPAGTGGPAGGSHESTERRRKEIAVTAADVMSAPAITAFPDVPITQAAQVMRRHRVAQLPVIDAANGAIEGLVTMSDALDTFLRCDDDIRDEIRHDIAHGQFAADAAGVSVNVRAGIVTITGQVRRYGVIGDLIREVRCVEGVVRVEPHLRAREDDRFPVPPLAW